jgi:hypothetical protein
MPESPLQLLPTLAQMLGDSKGHGGDRAAVFLQQVHYWSQTPYHNGNPLETKVVNGRLWVRLEPAVFFEPGTGAFRHLSPDTIKRIITLLRRKKLLLTANLNDDLRDTTNWYAIDYAEFDRHERAYTRKLQKETASVGKTTPLETPKPPLRLVRSADSEGAAWQGQNAPARRGKMHLPEEQNAATILIEDLGDNETHQQHGAAQKLDSQPTSAVTDVDDAAQNLLNQLRAYEVSRPVAQALIAHYDHNLIAQQLEWWPDRQEEVRKWGPGTLRRTIEQDWGEPETAKTRRAAEAAQAEQLAAAEQRRSAAEARKKQEELNAQRFSELNQRLEQRFEAMSPAEREAIDERTIQRMPGGRESKTRHARLFHIERLALMREMLAAGELDTPTTQTPAWETQTERLKEGID